MASQAQLPREYSPEASKWHMPWTKELEGRNLYTSELKKIKTTNPNKLQSKNTLK